MELLENCNIVMINLDGLRSDKIGLCPNLKKFYEENIFFSNMFTAVPYTFAALHAIFSGLYPSSNGVNAYYNIFKFKKDEITTIPQFLQKKGYYTCCDIISDSVMPKQGYDEWNLFDEKTVNFEQRHPNLIKQLSKKKKFFLFLHWTETHKHMVRDIVEKYKQEADDEEYYKAQKENNERYESYLPYCDNYVTSIIDVITELNLDKKTIIIFFSDHGTSIGEKKGEKFYGVFAYDYTIKVFCIIKFPGYKKKKTGIQCRTIDLFPTLLDISKADLGDILQTIQGKSLLPAIIGNNMEEREVFVETGGLYGPWPSPKKHNVFCIRKGNKKLIFNDTPQKWEFYDLQNDHNENHNLYDEKSSEIKFLKERLIFYLKDNHIQTHISS